MKIIITNICDINHLKRFLVILKDLEMTAIFVSATLQCPHPVYCHPKITQQNSAKSLTLSLLLTLASSKDVQSFDCAFVAAPTDAAFIGHILPFDNASLKFTLLLTQRLAAFITLLPCRHDHCPMQTRQCIFDLATNHMYLPILS